MLFANIDYYSHEFKVEENVIAAFFTTKTGTEYRVYFYPASDYFDHLPEDSIIAQTGYYFGFTKVEPNEGKLESFDRRIMFTIINVIREFYDTQGNPSILIFHCSDDGGNDTKRKRACLFDMWFQEADMQDCFKKYNEEIDINIKNEHGEIETDKEYMSLIIQCESENIDTALEEFQKLKDQIIGNKEL